MKIPKWVAEAGIRVEQSLNAIWLFMLVNFLQNKCNKRGAASLFLKPLKKRAKA